MHARQGKGTKAFLQAHRRMGCCGILAMPNTKPPVARVSGPNTDGCWTIEGYRRFLMESGAGMFEHVLTPLYLSNLTTPAMIEEGAKRGLLTNAKYYPPHATTGAFRQGEVEPMPFEHFINNGVFKAMEACDITLNIHGEGSGLSDEDWLDEKSNSENYFNERHFRGFLDIYRQLKIVREHISDRRTVKLILNGPDNLVATVCPQHVLYTIAALARPMAVGLRCEPVVKFAEDREELRWAITDPNNIRFFAGTDSAPHYRGLKETYCGCAAGCFTGGLAPQLYAMAFEQAGVDLATPEGQRIFRHFLVDNGNAFYGLPTSTKTFTLEKVPAKVEMLETPDGEVMPLPLSLKQDNLPWRIAA
jgi:dihydroorotase